jgi:hypothetical protein
MTTVNDRQSRRRGSTAEEAPEGGAAPRKPLIAQIFDAMFANMEGSQDFDAKTLGELKRLATRGELKKAAEVARAIKSGGDERSESAGT